MRKVQKLLLAAAVFCSPWCFGNSSHVLAKPETFIGSGEYVLGINSPESPEYAKKKALEVAKNDASEKAGIYFEQTTEVKNGKITDEEIKIICLSEFDDDSMVVNYELEDLSGKALLYRCNVSVVIDTDDIEKQARFVNKTSLGYAVQQRKKLEAEINRKSAEMEELNRRYQTALENERQLIRQESQQNEQQYDALQLVAKGEAYYLKNDYANAEKVLHRALEFDPNLSIAYSWLGRVYSSFGNIDKAIRCAGL